MFISVQIRLGPGEYAGSLAGNSEEIADRVIKAAGGDKLVDTCYVTILDAGMAGVDIPMQQPMFSPPVPQPPATLPPTPTPLSTNGN